jgi:hypothetical protein
MSRYVCHFLVNLSPQNVRLPLKMLFEACGMETMYETDDYVMAREIPGQIIFTKLVTSEVSIDVSGTDPDVVRLSFLVKNEELPLNSNNHCRQIFDLLRVAIAHNYDWESVDNLPQVAEITVAESESEPEAATETISFASEEDAAPISNTLNPVFN